jgi:hypothetical protein
MRDAEPDNAETKSKGDFLARIPTLETPKV